MRSGQLGGFGHAPYTCFAAGLLAAGGREYADAVGLQSGDVTLVGGLNHISTFIAGAAANGHLRAAAKLVSKLSAMPPAILAKVLALAGAITNTSAVR